MFSQQFLDALTIVMVFYLKSDRLLLRSDLKISSAVAHGAAIRKETGFFIGVGLSNNFVMARFLLCFIKHRLIMGDAI